jgi:acyl-coenzyme A thioesterase PaaI-like protein
MEPLAEELRAIIEELAVAQVPEADEERALALAQELRALLDGPRRPRWYDSLVDGQQGEGAHEAFLAHSPLRGAENPLAPPLVLEPGERADGTPCMHGRVRMGVAYEGPPHGVHGGYVAALFDEVLGATQGLAYPPGVTGTLTIRYRHVTPVEEDLFFESWVEADSGRRIVCKATCHAGDLLTAEGEGLFVRVDFEEVQARMQARRP